MPFAEFETFPIFIFCHLFTLYFIVIISCIASQIWLLHKCISFEEANAPVYLHELSCFPYIFPLLCFFLTLWQCFEWLQELWNFLPLSDELNVWLSMPDAQPECINLTSLSIKVLSWSPAKWSAIACKFCEYKFNYVVVSWVFKDL
jgi:hypothetical protein